MKNKKERPDVTEKKTKKQTVLEEVEDGEPAKRVFVIVNFIKMSDKKSLNLIRLPIPHPFREAQSEDLSVCLITKDPQRQYKDLVNPLQLSSITKIMGLSKLRDKFKPFEAKRNLCGSFDLFLADSSVIPMLPKLLGKTFFDKKKQPAPVNMRRAAPDELRNELKEAIESTYYHQTSGSNASIFVGHVSQSDVHIAANIEAVVKLLGKKLPGGLKNIRSVMVKTADSVALPVYARAASAETAVAE